jgi:uncharacterized protein (DUF1778 family)
MKYAHHQCTSPTDSPSGGKDKESQAAPFAPIRQIAVHLPRGRSSALTARLEARISTDLHRLLKRAAELQGRTMTDFVVDAVQDAAQRAVEQTDVICLSMADQHCFAEALLSPPNPQATLKRAIARRSKRLRTDEA